MCGLKPSVRDEQLLSPVRMQRNRFRALGRFCGESIYLVFEGVHPAKIFTSLTPAEGLLIVVIDILQDEDIELMHGERRYVHEWYKDSDTGTNLMLAKSLQRQKHLRGVKVELHHSTPKRPPSNSVYHRT